MVLYRCYSVVSPSVFNSCSNALRCWGSSMLSSTSVSAFFYHGLTLYFLFYSVGFGKRFLQFSLYFVQIVVPNSIDNGVASCIFPCHWWS